MVLKFVLSQRNTPMLVHNNYIYNKHSCSASKVIWRCAAYTTPDKCNCRVHTSSAEKDGVVLWESGFEHNHVVESAELKASKVKEKLKKDASKTSENLGNIIDKRLHNIDATTSYLLPNQKSLCRTIQRQRNQILNAPALPASVFDLNVPTMFTNTIRGDQFLLDDYATDNTRVLTFTTSANLKILRRCDIWQGDGTFDVVPSIFEQLYTIHGRYQGTLIPLVYILSTHCTGDIYKRVLETLVSSCRKLNPTRLIIDFENAYINAFSDVFPDSEIHGCFFHFAQCIWRHIQ
ncbi:hypothetical protein TKK_0005537 [Trichogramma kaykai]